MKETNSSHCILSFIVIIGTQILRELRKSDLVHLLCGWEITNKLTNKTITAQEKQESMNRLDVAVCDVAIEWLSTGV